VFLNGTESINSLDIIRGSSFQIVDLYIRDHTGTVSGTVPAQNNVGLVRSWNVFCSGAATC